VVGPDVELAVAAAALADVEDEVVGVGEEVVAALP
jgi:hypothetical protein